jgi:thiol:disulfide interchange protein
LNRFEPSTDTTYATAVHATAVKMSVATAKARKRSTKMSQSPVIRKLQPMEESKSRDVSEASGQWPKFLAIFSNPDLPMVVAFCLLGLLLALTLILRFPDFGAVIEQYNQF